MKTYNRFINLIVFLSLLFVNAVPNVSPVQAAVASPSTALVLVNSQSTGYEDFVFFIQPYLDHFGVPYTVLDVATTPISSDIGDYALIIIGHRLLDPTHVYLDTAEQSSISVAVSAGTGLVNFDNALSGGETSAPYAYIDTIFAFDYNDDVSGRNVSFDVSGSHYITQNHTTGDEIETGTMTLAGISLPAGVTRLAASGTQPFLAVTTFGSGGRAVQWGSYDWMSHAVRGPLMGLDDLVWRSLVWAARKPFVMQGMPPFVTMRMDDVVGPLDWIHISNEVGFKPWAGIFINQISEIEAADLKSLVDSGSATTSIHAFDTSEFFYFNHYGSPAANFSDEQIAANFAAGTQWHTDHQIPIAKYVVPHYYEVGSNALDGLSQWGIEFIGTMMDPGQLESESPWMAAGPYRKYEEGNAYDRNHNIYYADTLPTDNRFFNCITEFRDADTSTNYEWDPTPSDIPNSIAFGTKWLTDGLNGMDLATLFSHEYMLNDVDDASMRTIMQGIGQNIAAYNPIYVTMDDACRYARAVRNLDISAAAYDTDANELTVDFTGQTDVATKFYVFTNQGGDIQQALVDVPVSNGTQQVRYALPGPLDHIVVTPNPANVVAGVSQQFTAMGYDNASNPIYNLGYTWSAASVAGTINSSGLFTAGLTPGTFTNAISASFGGVNGYAAVEISQAILDHFSFDPISSPQYRDAAFPITIRARDVNNNPVIAYSGTALLSDGTATIAPAVTGNFTNGVWAGPVTVHQTGTDVTITAQDNAVSGASNTFAVNDLRQCPCSVWEGGGTPANTDVTDHRPIELGVKFRSDISGYILGVKFYKGALNTGSHIGHLWGMDGTQLAEAAFTSETASGWQQVLFDTPVAVTANTTYIASYYSPNGGFSTTADALNTRIDNAPLHVLANAEDGVNGLFRYDSTGFPTNTWVGHAPNYWVDVIFDTLLAREYSLWNGSGTPENASASDSHPIEVGTRFRSSSDGRVLGLRYYKGAGVTGAHTGHLWSSDGSLLGTLDFTEETGLGWQEARFAAPVVIHANSTYIASYFSPDGYFAITPSYFTGAVISPPLRALANGEDGPNGVFNPDSSAFPTTSGGGSNYWVDIVFTPSAVPDTTAPVITAVSPANNSSGWNVNANISAFFSEALNPTTVSAGTFELRDAESQLVPVAVSYNAANRMATLDPLSALAYSSTYTATVTGGITDVAGNALVQDYTWSFTTSAPPPPPPDEGPGGPILIIGSTANPFGRYYAEILRSEGLNEFNVTDITNVTSQMLAGYDLVLLAEMTLTADQVTMMTNWVDTGGNLIAMRPDKQLAGLLGLADSGGTLSDQYLRVDTTQGAGRGITGETIQFHSTADRYNADPTTAVLATLYSNAATATTNPAVSLTSVGSSGGQAAAFTYDLARSVVYTRQGNPAWVGQNRDSAVDPQNLIRSNDLFYGNAPDDPQPDWIDFNKIQIPQADEQQRLLANLILQMNADRKPLPRFWYFPRGEKAVIVMTGDDHNASGTAGRWDAYKAMSLAGCSVDNWECIRGTSYMYTENAMSDAQAAAYSADGFEVALHVNTGCGNFTPSSLETIISSQLSSFLTKYASIPPIVTQRTHCIAYSDWDSQPLVSAAHGVRLDANYYYWPPAWTQDRPGMFTGSGMIMRFARLDGSIIDSYQAATQMTDESGMSYPHTADVLLDNAVGPLGYYGAFTTNMHTDNVSHSSSDAIINAAIAHGVPVITASQMLTWLDGRNGSAFKDLAWDGSNLTFQITIGAGANGLQGMLPTVSGVAKLLNITLDGIPVSYTTETIKGVSYAIFNVAAGNYAAEYGVDSAGPAITAVTVTPDENNSAHIQWTTNEPATSRVDYGTGADSLTANAAAAALVTAHSLNLTGLNANMTYYYRLSSVDEAGNSTLYPPLGEEPLHFQTPAAVLTDTTTAHFAAGTPGACSIVENGNGEVILPAQVDAQFNGTGLPDGWQVTSTWSPGGSAVVSNGRVTLNSAMIAANATYPADSSLEFVATFSNQNTTQGEHIGLGTDLNGAPWAIFSTGAGGTTLKARTWGITQQETDLGSAYLGSPHHFRIDWLADRVDYSIDGALIATHAVTFATGTQMRPLASDLNIDTANLIVDWMRLSPYHSPCTFTSRVMDAGEPVNWNAISWTGSLPAGTNLNLRYRIGNTANLDSLAWNTVHGSSPHTLAGNSRFIQYQAELLSSTAQTPVLEGVTFTYQAGEDITAPTITNLQAAPDENGRAVITWETNEPSDSLVDYGTTPGALDLHANTADLLTAHSITLTGLRLDTTYYYRVTAVDAANNSAALPGSSEPPASFIMPIELQVLTDTTTAHFGEGTGACPVDPTVSDGALRLPAAIDEPFTDTELPAGWSQIFWNTGGAVTVPNGTVQLDGARINFDTPYNPGHVLEFTATFGSEAYQNMGFGAGSDIFNDVTTWAMFGTSNSTGTLYARTALSGSGSTDTPIAGNWLNAPHLYRIEWTVTGVNYFIDGNPVASSPVAISDTMRVAASDYNSTGTRLNIDWVRMSPYISTCAFTSRILDAGSLANWQNLAWSGSQPDGTGLTFEIRTSGISAPDASWSDWMPAASNGSLASPAGRYLQYRATLTTNSSGWDTPVIEQVTVSYNLVSNHAPTANAQSISVNEDTATAIILTGSDAEGEPLQYAIETQPAHGTLSGTAPDIIYTPALNYNSTDSFTFSVNDGTTTSSAAAVSIIVRAVNDAPVIAGQRALATDEDTPLNLVLADLTITDADGSDMTGFSLSIQDGANYTINGSRITPAHNFHGSLSIPLAVNDGAADSNIFSLAVTVSDLLPTSADAGGPYTSTAGGMVSLSGFAVCPAVDTCSYAWDLNGDGQYDEAAGPAPSYRWNTAGAYVVTLRVTDDDGNAITDTATVQVDPASHQIALQPGWNLVSFNLRPLDIRPEAVLASIAGKYELVYAWDASGASSQSGNWLKYDNIPSSSDSLTALNERMGFWIYMTEAANLDVKGSIVTNSAVQLYDNVGGWNLVGYPSAVNGSLPAVLQSHGVGDDYSLVYAYHASDTSDVWKLFERAVPGYGSDLTELAPGWGYWLLVNADKSWQVGYAQP